MSLKDGTGKSLSGNLSAALGGSIDMTALLAALMTVGLSLDNVTLTNIVAYSGMMDDVIIGSITPSSAFFTQVQIGANGNGGRFVVYGNKPTVTIYDANGKPVSTTPGDSVSWDPTTGTLNISGALAVRDPVQMGNIAIKGNQIIAVAPKDGDIELLPQSSEGYIYIGGNVQQSRTGIVAFDNATTFSVNATSTSTINSRYDSILSTVRGDIDIVTDVASETQINSIKQKIVTTSVSTSRDGFGRLVEVDVTQTILGDGNDATMSTIYKMFVNGVLTISKDTEQQKQLVDGQLFTVTTTTEIAYASDGKSQTTSSGSTTFDGDVPNPFVPLVGGTSTFIAVVATQTRHDLSQGDTITLIDTDSIPSYDGQWTVRQVLSPNAIVVDAIGPIHDGHNGVIMMPKVGSISLDAAKAINFPFDVPLSFGSADLDYRPTIIAPSQDELQFGAHYLRWEDPIVTLESPQQMISDTGIAVHHVTNGQDNYSFFGFSSTTQNLTWIPSATILRNDDGTKLVQGARGIMELDGIKVRTLTGDPGISISADDIQFDSGGPIRIFPALAIGNSGTISVADDGLTVSADGILHLDPSASVSIPSGKTLTFSDESHIVGDPTTGALVISSDASVNIISDVFIPVDHSIHVGNNLISASNGSLRLTATTSIDIPDNVVLQIGDTRTSGFVCRTGTLNGRSVGDFAFVAGGNVAWTAGNGIFTVNASQLVMPEQAEILFSTANYLSTIGGNRLTLHSDDPIVVESVAGIQIQSQACNLQVFPSTIDLNAVESVNVSADVPLTFGSTSRIVHSSTDGRLHIVESGGVLVDKDLTVNGSLTVYGPTTEIISTQTTIEDPIITLGATDAPEYVKDRGIQFWYGDGSLGFMGFSQQDGRFYIVKTGQNVDEVFTKDNLGDLVANGVVASAVSSTGGLKTTIIQGDPYLHIDSSDLFLNAVNAIHVPADIPVYFGSSSSDMSITGNDALIKIGNIVTISERNLSIDTSTATSVAQLEIGDATLTDDATTSVFALAGISVFSVDGDLIVARHGRLSTDSDDNFIVQADNNIVLDAPTTTQSTFTVGNARMSYDGTQLVFADVDPNASLHISFRGSVSDATWMGHTIGAAYGGTGRADDWHENGIVFVSSDGTFLDEDASFLSYDHVAKRLSIGGSVSDAKEILSVQTGNVELLDDNGGIFFSDRESHSWRVGKRGTNFTVTAANGVDDPSDPSAWDDPVINVNRFNQVAIGSNISTAFDVLDGTDLTRILLGSGDVDFVYPTSAIKWSSNAFIRSDSDGNLILSGGMPSGNVSIASYAGMSLTCVALTVSTTTMTVDAASSIDLVCTADLNLSSRTGNVGVQTDAGIVRLSGNDGVSFATGNVFTFETFGDDDVRIFADSNMVIASGHNLSLIGTDDASLSSTSGNVDIKSGNDFTLDANGNAALQSAALTMATTSAGIDLSSATDFNLTAGTDASIACSEFSLIASDSCTVVGQNALSLSSTTSTRLSSEEGNTTIYGGTGLILQSAGSIDVTSNATTTLTANILNISTGGEMTLSSNQRMNIVSGDVFNVTADDGIYLASSRYVNISAQTDSTFAFGQALSVTASTFSLLSSGVDVTSDITGTFSVSASRKVLIDSPHMQIMQRICFHHDPSTDACQMWMRHVAGSEANGGLDLEIVNEIGNILLSPNENVVVPVSTHILFSDAGDVGIVDGNVSISALEGDIIFSPPDGGHVRIYPPTGNGSIWFGDDASVSMSRTDGNLNIAAPVSISLQTPIVNLPFFTPIVFGNDTQRIESDGDTLYIYSSDSINLQSNTVRVAGNLIVSKQSTFTVETETMFDSNVVVVGGQDSNDIANMTRSDDGMETVVTLNVTAHHLRPGDSVTLMDTVPDIDGDYIVSSVPADNSFTVPISFPGLPEGATAVKGIVRNALTRDSGFDEGVQFNWHVGGTFDTLGTRTGFFGFDRSSLRFVYIPEATRNVDNTYTGAVGDFQMNDLYADGISANRLLSSLDATTFSISGSNFVVSGGSVDGTPIGSTIPSTGTFTDVVISGTLTIGDGSVVDNLNADLVDGYHADSFVFRDGSRPLTADWFTGPSYGIVATGLSDVTLASGGIVTTGDSGRLKTFADLTFANGILKTAAMDSFRLVGDVDLNGQKLTGGNLVDNAISGGSMTSTGLFQTNIVQSTLSSVTVDNSIFEQGTITSTSFVSGTVTASTLTNVNVNDSHVATTTIDESSFTNGTIDSSTMTAGSIQTTTIDSSSFANGRIETSQFVGGTIVGSTLTDNEFVSGTISQSSIDETTITKSGYSSGTIDSSAFVDGTIDSSAFSGGTITETVMSTSTIDDVAINNSTVSVSTITGSGFDRGDVTNSVFTAGNITQSTFVRGNVQNSDISLEAANFLDVSRGTVVFADDQISGDYVAGGTADVDIAGNAATVTDGVYRRDFSYDDTLLKADVANDPIALTVPEQTLIGRTNGGHIDAIPVDAVQTMLDVLKKSLFVDDSILKADVADDPKALQIPEGTVVGRTSRGTISALTTDQLISMIMTTEVLHRYGALLRDGHRTYSDGGTMSGLLYYSTERISLTTGQTQSLDVNVESSYVTANYSRLGGRIAYLTLNGGFADGHRKFIVASNVAENAIIQINCDIVAPDTVDPYVLVLSTSGQSVQLQWDTVQAKWLIINSGCDVLTRDDMRDPNWIDNLAS